MQAFKFSTRGQAKTYTIFTVISVLIGIFVFSDFHDLTISSSVAFLIAIIISFISLMISVKKANKTFEEIIIDEKKVSFYFSNKIKDKIVMDIDTVSLIEKENLIEIIEEKTGVSIDIGYKNRIENSERMEVLINCFNNTNC